jgi:hypothetical protein
MLSDGEFDNVVQQFFPYVAVGANSGLACRPGRYFSVGQANYYHAASHFSSITTTSLISQSLSDTPAAIAGVMRSVL